MRKHLILSVSVMTLMVAFTGCGNKTKVSLDKTTLSLLAGEIEKLAATVEPEDAGNKGVIWTSSNNGVATVTADGTVTAIDSGTAIISATAQDGSKKAATCSLTVASIYASGFEWNSNFTGVGTVWKNGSLLYKLVDGKHYTGANSVVVSGKDVYAAGYCGGHDYGDGEVGAVWKNGHVLHKSNLANEVESTGDNSVSIAVAGNDVYAVGGSEGITVWKNGNVLYGLTNENYGPEGDDLAECESIAVAGNDVYAVGWGKNSQSKYVATVWKNGKVLYRLTDGNYHAFSYSVAVAGNDVYVVGCDGYKDFLEGNAVAMVWKNGNVLYKLTDGKRDARGYSITVESNDIYVLGTEKNSQGKDVGTVWKNGHLLYRLGDGYFDTSGSSLTVLGNDVYVAGIDRNLRGKNVATVWKNGNVIYRLTDEKNKSLFTSVSVLWSNHI